MALPFFNTASKGRDQLVAIDLGGRTTKAVHLHRNGTGLVLSGFALLDAPLYEKNLSVELLSEHLKNISQALDVKAKQVSLAVGVNESLVRRAEIPLMPREDMRQILKNNAKTYLQQDLPGHVFDCHIIPPRQTKLGGKDSIGGIPKAQVIAAGAKKQYLDDTTAAIRQAGLIPDQIVPGMLGPVNAFEMAMPEIFAKEVVALVDIGFKNSTICVLQEGELMLSRVVHIGGDRMTNGLAESLGISYAEAEGIKIGMPTEVQSQLEALVLPLGRELRASIDFFEHQQDKTVTKVLISGASARSDLIVQTLQNELLVECKMWNPAAFLHLALPPQQTTEIEQVAPQLTVAIGTAVAAF